MREVRAGRGGGVPRGSRRVPWAGQSVAVAADEAEDTRCEKSARVEPPMFLEEADAGDLELLDFSGDVERKLARDADEAAAVGELVANLAVGEAERFDRGECLRGGTRIGDRLRIGVDRLGGDALGEHAQLGVEDRAARRRQN